MSYAELVFRTAKSPDKMFYSDVARKIVAEGCDGLPVNPLIFNRTADGKTITGRYGDDRKGEGFGIPPAIIFDGGKGFIRLYGIGREGAEVLNESAPLLFAGVSKQLGLMGITPASGTCNLVYQPGRMMMYAMHRIVVSKKPNHKLSNYPCSKYIGTPIDDVANDIRRHIARGLISQARWLDEQRVPGTPSLESRIPDDSTLGIEILEGVPIPVEIKKGVLASAYRNVVFAMPLELTGPWIAGLMRSRGYGLIRRVNPTREGDIND